MLSALRRRITPATVIASLALVFAMTGGAYAANHFLITSAKQISPKVRKQLQGKTGTAGINGAAGPQGPAGVGGAQGPAGAGGAQGPQGPQGPAGPKGPQGPQGATGFVKTLPAGESLKGEWSVSGAATAGGQFFVSSVTFAFPLKEAPTAHFVAAGASAPAGCTGTAEEPGAEEGNLCVFAGAAVNLSGGVDIFDNFTSTAGASPFGFTLFTESEASGQVLAKGTWALTAAN